MVRLGVASAVFFFVRSRGCVCVASSGAVNAAVDVVVVGREA